MEIKTIGVVGAGQMGNGIAQVAAQSGFRVVMSGLGVIPGFIFILLRRPVLG